MPPRQRRANKRRIKHPNSSRPALSKAFNGSQLLETVALIGLVLFVAIIIWAYQLISSNVGEDNGAGISPQSLPRVLELQNIQKLGVYAVVTVMRYQITIRKEVYLTLSVWHKIWQRFHQMKH